MIEGKKLPQGWISAQLSDIASILMGQSPPSSTYNSDGNGLPFFQGKAEFGDLYPEAKTWCSRPNKIAEADDILFSVRAPVGPTNLAPSRCCIGRGLAAIRPEADSNLKYLLYLFRHFAEEFDAKGTGTTFKAVSGKTIREFLMPVAPTEEQSRIADALDELFSDLDAGVAALERVQEKLKLYRASVLKAAVEGALTAEWRAKNPKSEPAPELLKRILVERRRRWEEDQLAKFKAKGQEPPKNWKAKYKEPVAPDTAYLPSLPEGWAWCSGEQLFWFITSGSRGWAKYYSDSGSLFIRMGNLDHGSIKLDLSEIQRVSPPDSAEGVRTQIEPKDILISITADVGMVALVPDDIEDAYINQHVALARPVLPDIGPFIAWYLAGPSGQKRLKDLQRGATKVGLGLDDIRNVVIPMPPLVEQEAIIEAVEDQLSVIDHLESELEAKLKTAQSLRQSILHQAFTGQLVPQSPKDQPASELLKRIAAERATRAREVAQAKRPLRDRKSPGARKGRRSKQHHQGER